MKKIKRDITNSLLGFIGVMVAANTFANDEFNKQEIIDSLRNNVSSHYVLPDKAKEVNSLMGSTEFINKFSNINDKKQFANALQKEIQTILSDKHFRVLPPRVPQAASNQNLLERHQESLTNFRKGGFKSIEMLDGNVGYVKVDGFRSEDKHKVDGLMNFLRTADAIIIDLRENGGGGQPVNYFTSYFLADNVVVGKTYHRYKDSWKVLKTEPIKGDKRLEVPLFILTSDFTFSAAEAFAYNLQARKRATIVGEVSGGGAHPIQFMPLPNGFRVIMPNRRSYNEITKSNWEGTGVVPDVLTNAEHTLDKAKELAKLAAQEYRSELFDELATLLFKQCDSLKNKEKVDSLVNKLLYRRHIEPFMVKGFSDRLAREGHQCGSQLLAP
jgi:hypothetical protein